LQEHTIIAESVPARIGPNGEGQYDRLAAVAKKKAFFVSVLN